MMIAEMLSKCKAKDEARLVINSLLYCTETICDELGREWDIE